MTNLFASGKPIELEIGMGRPHYIFERAKAMPERDIIGIEYKNRWVKAALARKERDAIGNVHPIFGDATVLVPELIPDNSLANITTNFPDPWWKRKHHKRRILKDRVLEMLVPKLQIGGTLFLQTDVAALFDEYLENLELHPRLSNCNGPRGQSEANPMDARSHREKKCEENGVKVYRALFERVR